MWGSYLKSRAQNWQKQSKIIQGDQWTTNAWFFQKQSSKVDLESEFSENFEKILRKISVGRSFSVKKQILEILNQEWLNNFEIDFPVQDFFTEKYDRMVLLT